MDDVEFVEVVVGEGHHGPRMCRCWTGVDECCRLERVERVVEGYDLGRMVDSLFRLAWENVDASLDPNRNLDAVWSGDAA